MRIITLNCWGGRAMHALMDFFRRRKDEADAFLLQEVFDGDQDALERRHPGELLRADMFERIGEELGDFEGFFAAFEDPDRMSTAIFVRESIAVEEVGVHAVYEPENPRHDGHIVFSPRRLQTARLDLGGRKLLLANLHGLWNNAPKTDTPERLAQSRRVIEVLKAHAGPKILAGDFNLLPDTASVRMLEVDAGLRNLVLDHDVRSTRTPFYRHYENPDEPNFADYVMPSRDLAVMRFEVLPDLVSDHAPLYAEFS